MKTEQPKRTPVKDTVKMFAVRMIGRNVPHTELTYFPEEAQKWMVDGSELVAVEIKPFRPRKNG